MSIRVLRYGLLFRGIVVFSSSISEMWFLGAREPNKTFESEIVLLTAVTKWVRKRAHFFFREYFSFVFRRLLYDIYQAIYTVIINKIM